MDNQDQHNPQSMNPTPLPVLSGSTEAMKPLNKTDRLKRSFFQVLIGCLLGAASIAVIAVLVGKFNDVLGRSLGTIAMVALHATLSFSYIAETGKRDKKDGGRSIELFGNTVFVLIALSFITSIFAIWQLLDGSLTLKLYLSYGVLLFATLHADILFRIRRFERQIDNVVTANYFLMATVVTMLFIVIFSGQPSDLGEFFYRLLAAAGIIDATMTITAVILHKLYLQKHPELAASAELTPSARSKNFWKNPLVILLLIFLTFQVIGSLVALLLHGF
jgi:hypothetical protein